MNCVFCDRIENGDFIWESEHAVAFQPLNPVTEGHLLVVPKKHVPNFSWDPDASAAAMKLAAAIAINMPQCNLVTSKGSAATQTVYHLHLHLVPRQEGDGLHLPWTGQHAR